MAGPSAIGSSKMGSTTAEVSVSLPGITDEEVQRLRLIKLITSVGQRLMYRVFVYGCPNKDQQKNLKEYLVQDVGMSNKAFKDAFDSTNREQIISSPSCEAFDVTLLFKAIKVACDHNIADKDSTDWHTPDDSKLEYLLKLLKDERNELFHRLPKQNKAQVLQRIEELRTLLGKIIEAYAERFSIDDTARQQHLDELHLEVDRIRDQPLTDAEIHQHREEFWLEYIKSKILNMGVSDLRKKFKNFVTFNPLSFLDDFDTHLSFQSVFSELVIVQANSFTCNQSIDHKNILELAGTEHQRPCLVLIKGAAGSGKSTLIRWLMLEWSNSNAAIPGLKDFDLLIHLECRSRHISSLKELLKFLILETCCDLGDNIIPGILNLRVLFLLDGLDELNSCSDKTVQEILHHCKSRLHMVLCTSRPEKTREFLLKVPGEYQKFVLEIKGIQPKEQGLFAGKYHDELVRLGKSTRSTEGLVHYVEKSSHFQGVYRFPINLVLLAYLWACYPNLVDEVTTATELYEMLYGMLKDKLLQRLVNLDSARNFDIEEIEEKIGEFARCLSMEALISLSRDEVILELPSKKRLRAVFSKDDAFQFKDIVSTYLTLRVVRKKHGSEEQLCFPHKDNHDYFAAKGLLLAITDKHFYLSLRKAVSSPCEKNFHLDYDEYSTCDKVIQYIMQMLSRSSPNFSKYQNVFKHLAGLLQSEDVMEHLIQELVEVFGLSGISSQDQWLDILAEAKCNDQISCFIAKSFFTRENIFNVKSSRVAGFTSLMPYLNPSSVILDLDSNPEDLPHLTHLLELISKKDCRVALQVLQHYQNPEENKTTDPLLLCLLHQHARCQVYSVHGHLSGTGPVTELRLEELYVVLSSDRQAAEVTSNLLQQPHNLKQVRVMPGVAPHTITPLPPGLSENRLDLSLVTLQLLDWGRDVAVTLARNTRLKYVILPSYLQGAEAGLRLEEKLSASEVSVDNFLPFSYVQKVEQLRDLVSVSVSDRDTERMLETMAFASPLNVNLDFAGDPQNLSCLKQLLRFISEKSSSVVFQVWWHYHLMKDVANTDVLLACFLDARCKLVKFSGLVSAEMALRLPTTLREVRLSLTTDAQASATLPRLHSLPNLECIGLHVAPGVDPASLCPLPNISHSKDGNCYIFLDISGVGAGSEERAGLVAAKLQPPRGFWSMWFPWAVLEVAGYIRIIEELAQRDIRVKEVGIPLTSATKSQYRKLKSLANVRLEAAVRLTPSPSGA